jgi:hypothetical protein
VTSPTNPMFRKVCSFALIVLIVVGCNSKHMQHGGEKAFWDWFQANDERLYNFERDQEPTFDQLHAELRKVHKNLVFEFGSIENGRREFIISADGIREAFPKVESLYAAAPALSRWKVVKYRPRREPMDIALGDLRVDCHAVVVDLQPHSDKVDLTLYLPGYSEHTQDKYKRIAFLFLDQALGEYDVETRVGYIDLKARDEAPPRALSLAQLPGAFDSLLKPH